MPSPRRVLSLICGEGWGARRQLGPRRERSKVWVARPKKKKKTRERERSKKEKEEE